jgi:hypothetical protein
METKHPVSSSGQETVEASNAFRFDAPKAGGRIRGVALFARAVDPIGLSLALLKIGFPD